MSPIGVCSTCAGTTGRAVAWRRSADRCTHRRRRSGSHCPHARGPRSVHDAARRCAKGCPQGMLGAEEPWPYGRERPGLRRSAPRDAASPVKKIPVRGFGNRGSSAGGRTLEVCVMTIQEAVDRLRTREQMPLFVSTVWDPQLDEQLRAANPDELFQGLTVRDPKMAVCAVAGIHLWNDSFTAGHDLPGDRHADRQLLARSRPSPRGAPGRRPRK